MRPSVSVVIPTRGRPDLLRRAIGSVLAQTVSNIEVIVVIDGVCEASHRATQSFGDSRLRCMQTGASVGAAAARNAGVSAATARWTAFLDDDDEWLPRKLELQLAAVDAGLDDSTVVVGRLEARSSRGSVIVPRRWPRTDERIDEYLFVRAGLFQGEALISTTALMVPTALMREVPFTPGLPCHQEWDWVIRAFSSRHLRLRGVEDVVGVWHVADGRRSVTNASGWVDSWSFLTRNRELLSPAAQIGFIATVVAPRAARSGDAKVFLMLAGELRGAIITAPRQVVLFLALWLMPQPMRSRGRHLSARCKLPGWFAASREVAPLPTRRTP
jgi:glycosyltransferase involved in cell wall biosynthesis